MKIFIDSADIDEIKKANELGIIDGVTTNPSLIAKEIEKDKEKTFEKIILEIVDEINVPINVEVMSTETEEMIKEAIKLSELSKNIVIKIPTIPSGLKAVRMLKKKNPEIKTNMTLIFGVCQSLLVARVGATYASIFVGRLDDIGYDGMEIVRDSVKIFDLYNIDTEIITASVRHPIHVIEAAKARSHIATIPFNVLEKMISHILTDKGIEKFMQDYEKFKLI